ncbi:MAG: 1-(5-phosphoribosyl)-5-[(5-phosphoribosylamino)methylideneamino]imidazole-4-carboxamide isomerase [Deltaproteobacteria bacterium]|nr:1-(5-phosphoribosyl)-5-[(5-phosphoribosylamino)methylideneamino]imidazole-4-carboxamide isomerase [Deltaproteobacteria bacterium]
MILIPAVDLKQGQCVRLREGRADAVTVFSEDPVAMGRQWAAQGAERLHVVDLDGAFEKGPRHFEVVEKIVRSLTIPVQVGGGLRDLDTVQRYLDVGVAQVILGTMALKKSKMAAEACRRFPGRIIIGLDARDNRVAVEGWTEISASDPLDLAQRFEGWGVSAVIFTDIRRDGTQRGPAVRSTQRLARALSVPVIAAGGIVTLADVQKMSRLEKDGVVGVITGRAIYSGSLRLPEALAWLRKHTAPTAPAGVNIL